MKINKIGKNIWEIQFDDYINMSNYFKTTGDILMKLDRIEKDLYRMLQNIFDIQSLFKKIKKDGDEISYLETFVENEKFYIKAKKSRARRVVIKKEEDEDE